jgi:acyl-coenzyme A thioesterase PaaI-like protein
MPSALHERVERSIVVSSEAKLAFPGVLMGITGRQAGDDAVTLTLKDDPVFRAGNGELDWCALVSAADAVLGAVSDIKTGPRVRPATAHIELQMTGAPARGDIFVDARFIAPAHTSRVRQSLVSADIRTRTGLVGQASAACVLLDLPKDRARTSWPWPPEGFTPAPRARASFDSNERLALQMCERAEAAATSAHPFIEHFWCGIPAAQSGKAHLRVNVAPHLGNRIGHVQGGLLLGTAVKVANAAAREDMRLSNISAYFLSPALGPVLDVHSHVTHQGRSLATVRTQITAPSGKAVLEATSQHVLT